MNKRIKGLAGTRIKVGNSVGDQLTARVESDGPYSTVVEVHDKYNIVRILQENNGGIDGVVFVNPNHMRDIGKQLLELADKWEKDGKL